MANGGRINFQVGFNVDKSGLNSLKSSLQSLQKMKITDFSGTNEELRQIKNTAKQVQQALQKAFNANLGSLNINKFNQELQKSKLNVNQIYSQFSKAGAQGQAAFSKMAQSVLTTNLQLRQTNSLVSKMGTTLMNTIKWNISSSIVQNFTNSIRQAFQYVQALDASLTDIRIVTGDSTDQMRQFARQANNAAQALGRSTMDYTKAALTFYQQGLDDQSVAARTQATLQAQNITGAGQEMADYLTAVWNGYKVANEQAQLYVDRLAAVADSSASNMAQLATAMSKVAATANAMGVDVDQLNAQIATIIATTRQAPETVGNALKTIFARINDIQAGTQDAEVSLGHYTGTMAELGINVLDASGHLRDTGQVMEEIGEKWATMSREQQIYLARTMAGQRQYNNLIALFDNWGRYTELVNVSMDSQGTLMEKNSRYMDSLGAKMEQLGAAGEKVKDALIDEQDMKGLITAVTKIVSTFGSFIQGIGGARGALLGFGSIALQIFSGVISKEINTQVINLQNYKNNLDKINEAQERLGTSGSQFEKGGTAQYVGNLRALQQYWSVLSNEEKQAQQDRANEISSLRAQQNILEANTQKAKEFYQAITGKDLASASEGAIERITGTIQSRVEALKQSLQEIHNNTILNQGTGFGISDEQKEQNLRALEELDEKTKQLMQSLGAYGETEGKEILNLINNMRSSALGKQGLIDENELTNVIDKLDELSNKVQSQNGKVVNYRVDIQGAEEARQKADELQQTFNRINQEASQLFNIQSTVQFASSIGRLASSINTIVNLTKVWKNENLSLGEKLLQTFMSLGFAAGMFISSLKNITTFVAKAVKVTGDLFGAASEEVQTTFIQAHTEAIRDQIKEEDRLVLSKMLANKASLANIAATGQELAATQQERIQKRLLSMEEQGHTKSVLANVAAKIKQFIAQKLLNEQRKKALLSMFPYIAAIAAITAAAIAAAVALYNLWKKPQKEAENAAKVAHQAAQKYKQIKQAYDDLKQSLQDYSSAQEALNQLTRGTQEWRDALLEANEAVLQLLNTYPQLAQYVTNEDGRLIISEQGQQTLLQQQRRAVEAAQRASTGLAAQSRQADINYQATQLSRESAGYFSTNKIIQIANEYIRNNGVLQGYARTAQFQKMINSAGFRQLTAAIQANTAAIEVTNASLIDNAFSDNSIYEGFTEAGQQVANTIGAAAYQANADKIYESIAGALQRTTRAGSQVEIYRDLETGQVVINTLQDWVKEYTQAVGIQATLTSGNAVTKDENGNLVVNLIDSITGETIPVLQQYMQMTIATARAMDQVQGATLERIQEINTAIRQSGHEDALNSWITTGGLGDLTQAEVDALSNIDLEQVFGNNLEIVAERFGWEYNEVAQQFSNLVDHYNDGVNRVVENLYIKVRQAFNNLTESGSLDNFTANQRQNIARQLNRAYAINGQQGLENLSKFYQGLNVLSEEERQTFDELIGSIDFNYMTVNRFNSLMRDAGISIETTNAALQQYINMQQTAAQLIDYQTRYAQFQQLKDKLNQIGAVIEQEDYNKLAQQLNNLGFNVDEFFTHLADGTYQLIQITDEFNRAINFISTEALRNSISYQQSYGQNLSHYNELYQQNDGNINGLNNQQRIQFLIDVVGQEALGDVAQTVFDLRDKLIDRGQDLDWRQTEELVEIVGHYSDKWESVGQQINESNELLAEQQEQLANSVDSVEELWRYFDEGLFLDSENNLNNEAFDLAMNRAYQGMADEFGQTAEAMRYFSEEAQEVLLETEQFTDDIDNAARTANVFTEQVGQINSGLQDLQSTWSDFEDILNSEEANAWDLAGAFSALQTSIQEMFGHQLSQNFVEQNLQLIRAAANGDIEALNQLAQLAAHDFWFNLELGNIEQFGRDLDYVQSIISGIENQTISVDAVLDDSNFVAALNRMMMAGEVTRDEVVSTLGEIGYTPNIQYVPVEAGGVSSDIAENTDVAETTIEGTFGNTGTPFTATLKTVTHRTTGGAMGDKHTFMMPQIVPGDGGGNGLSYTKPIQNNNISLPLRQPKTSGSGGGGGGKGSGSTAKPSVQKPSQDTRDPYHDINRLLDKQKEKLDDIQKQDKKLVNRDRLNNINAQNKALEEQANLLENKLAIAESEQIRLRNQLLADTNGYAQFGANGQITNFNQMLANAEKQYNDYIAYYNTLSKQQQDAEKDRLDLEKERYQRVKKTADEYEKTLDLQRDLLEQINENQEKQYENLIKQSQIRVDLAVDTGDLEREYLDFENKFIKKLDKDNFLGNAKANVKELMSYFNSDQIKKRNEEINSLNAIIQRIEKHGGGAYVDPQTGYNLAAAQERLNELFKDQTKALQEIDSLVEDIQKQYLDSLKDAKDKMDDQIDQYERINDLLDHGAKLAQLIYGDKAYASLEKYYNLQQDNDERALNNLRMQQQYWQSQLNNEVVGSDAWLQIKKNLDDITDDINDKLQDIIDRLADQWEARVKKITDQMENALTGGRGLSFLDEQWDYVNQYDDNFLDTLESKFGIQQVQTLYQEALDSVSGDPKSQQKLNDLMQKQLKLLREKDKLTQYDIERAKAALEVEKARLALENQRDNKSKMRLRRDSQGNYTYQYVADEQKLSDLQAALNDAQANLYNMDKEHYKENLDEFYGAFKDYKEKMVALAQQLRQANAAGDKEEEERIKARMALLDESFTNFFDGLTEDNRYSLQYLAESFGDGMGFDKETQQAEGFFDIMKENIPQVALDIQNLIDNISSQGGIMSAMQEFREGLQASNTQYFADLNKYMTEAGTSAQTVMQVTDDYGNALDTAVEKAKQFLPYYDKMIVDSIEAVEGIRDVIEQIEELLDEKLDDNELVKSLREAFNQLEALNRYFNPETKERSGKVTAQNLDVVERNIDTTENGAGVITAQDWRNYLNNQSTSQPITLANINAIGQLDADTLNSLSNEDVLLNVIGTIKYLTDSMGAMVNQQIGSMIKEASSYIGNIENVEKLDQNVHIEANFPNVIQAEEIKAAFNNLVNMAAQAAYKPNTT